MAWAEDVNNAETGKNITIAGMVELETAEMLKARITYSGRDVSVDHAWYSHLLGTFNINAAPAPYLKVRSGFEFRQYMNMSSTQYNPKMNNSYNLGDFLYHDFFIREAQGIFSIAKNESMSLEVAAGLMPYKYNPEVRELGEFLFRSGTYPLYLTGEFDRPFARLTGLRGSFNYGNEALGAKMDVLVLTERETRPFWDVSIAAVASAHFFKMIDVGAGVDFAHVIPMDSRLTTPQANVNSYILDSTEVIDSASGQPTGAWNYKYGYYSFKGTKLMLRATIDPFGMIRGKESTLSDIVGKNGGKIYAEGAIIGLENYPANLSISPVSNPYGYDKLKEKIPFMAGINIPFWKILDVCALEFEYFPSPNPNSAISIIKDGYPLPFYAFNNREEGYDTGSGNAYVPRWYWSVYLKKQIVKNFSVVAQVGRDHIRWEMPLIYQTSNYDYEDAMVKPDEWGWHIKTIFNF